MLTGGKAAILALRMRMGTKMMIPMLRRIFFPTIHLTEQQRFLAGMVIPSATTMSQSLSKHNQPSHPSLCI
jgi:hypothetical protein